MNWIDGVHDPTIVEHDGKFYLFSTDTLQPKTAGVPIRSSADLLTWQFEKTALPGVPDYAREWTGGKSGAIGLWAPEVIHVASSYRMYYSASTFGSRTSVIGLAEAQHPLGPWKDLGSVVQTSPQIAPHNAIDANICFDRSGQPWLTYGSFFGGIYLAKINPATGKLLESGYGQLIAKRPSNVDGAIEGAFIYYAAETDYFYLFVSFDSLMDTYNIRVARSKEITGPYVDWSGQLLTNQTAPPAQVGTKLLGSYQFAGEQPNYAPGHNSILRTKAGKEFIVHHMRRQPNTENYLLNVRELFWLSSGWPVVAAAVYQGVTKQTQIQLSDLQGEWEIICFSQSSQLVVSRRQELEDLSQDNQTFSCSLGEFKPYWVKINDSESAQLQLTGINEQGFSFIGKQVVRR